MARKLLNRWFLSKITKGRRRPTDRSRRGGHYKITLRDCISPGIAIAAINLSASAMISLMYSGDYIGNVDAFVSVLAT